MISRKHARRRRYGFAFVLMVGVILVTGLTPLASVAGYPILLVAVLISTWYGGLGPGLLATVLALLAALDFAEPPLGSLTFRNSLTLAWTGLFLVSAILVALITAERERAQDRLYRLNAELEERVAERTIQLETANAELRKEMAERRQMEEQIQKLNQTLQRRAVDLENANKELEAFTYSVSHDLRMPLGAIDQFVRALVADYGTQLPGAGRQYLDLIHKHIQAMEEMVQDMLTLSRAGRQPLHEQTVDTAALVRDLVEELRRVQGERRIEFIIGELLPCHADPVLLKQVWANLLSNALKFTRRRESARIEIGSSCQEHEGVYYVRDNGAGFDMTQGNKLFNLFQRLHSDDDYEGTGVGLSIVARIINRHGGRVWAEGAVDQGATFYFALPTSDHPDIKNANAGE